MSLLTLTLILFFIMDPLGNIHHFLNHIEGIKPTRQRFIIIREMLFALIAMVIFSIIGDSLLSVLALSPETIYIASGVILLLTALKILFSPEERFPRKSNEEPFLVPLAIPIIAGPALLATVMLFSNTEPSVVMMMSAIFIAWIASSILLLFSKQILNVLGTGGLTACERLVAMVLVLLSVQRIAQGVLIFLGQHSG